MRKEYDLRGSKPNPYAARIDEAGRKLLVTRLLASEGFVQLDADVAAAFPDQASVNEALRLVLQLRAVGTVAKAPTRRAGRKPAAR